LQGSIIAGSVRGDTTFITAVQDFNFSERFKINPNPASDKINIYLPDQTGTLEVLDADGRLIQSFNVNKGELLVDVANLDNGLYFIRFTGNINTPISKKLIVSRE
jgi:hypothetical protein